MTAQPAASLQASGVFAETGVRGLEKRVRPTIFS